MITSDPLGTKFNAALSLHMTQPLTMLRVLGALPSVYGFPAYGQSRMEGGWIAVRETRNKTTSMYY